QRRKSSGTVEGCPGAIAIGRPVETGGFGAEGCRRLGGLLTKLPGDDLTDTSDNDQHHRQENDHDETRHPLLRPASPRYWVHGCYGVCTLLSVLAMTFL